jgi:phospholipase C
VASRPIEHVVLIIKENHGFDNDFGTYPGANGLLMPPSPNPPQVDPSHTHATWWKRDTKAVRQQFQQADIPAYFAYAKQFTLCDNYFTDMAGPSTPNHLMLITAASPIIANPSSYRLPPGRPLFDLPSLPMSLEKAGLSWANYGGYPFAMIKDLHTSPKHSSQQFAADASAGQLPTVSWVNAPHDASEHAPDLPKDAGNPPAMRWLATSATACSGRSTKSMPSSRAGCGRRRRSSSPGTTGAADSITSPRPTSSHGATARSFVTVAASAVWCSARMQNVATFQKSCTRTSAW